MIEIKDKRQCSGCSACMAICPSNSISMQCDAEGFYYPNVNIETCINCNQCNDICPVENQFPKRDPQNAFAAKVIDIGKRLESSSGGIFTLFAEKILSEHGVVYGAAYDDNYSVHHIGITNFNQLPLLKGSKYLQSRMENAYVDIQSHVRQGKKILFVGTPCQVAGLNAVTPKKYEDSIITIELCCHGIASPLIWQKYLKEKGFKPEIIEYVNFKSRANGITNYTLDIKARDKRLTESKLTNSYMKGFLFNLYCRPICSNCTFRQFATNSDISIGDFWGIQIYYPTENDEHGCNQVLVLTNKGKQFIDSLCFDSFKTFNITLGEAYMGNTNYINSSPYHPKRDLFWKLIDEGKSVEESVNICFNDNNRRFITRLKSKLKKWFKW